MATKTKKARSVDDDAAIQEEIREVQALLRHAAYSLDFSTATEAAIYLRSAKTTLSRCASHLRDLLKTQKHGRSPSRRPGEVSLGRKYVAGVMPTGPRLDSRKSKSRVRKGVSRKQAGKEFFHEHELPH